MGKKLPETLATLLTPEMVADRPVRLMFQDEARLGRMVRPRRGLGTGTLAARDRQWLRTPVHPPN
jgi:hypothetical protein